MTVRGTKFTGLACMTVHNRAKQCFARQEDSTRPYNHGRAYMSAPWNMPAMPSDRKPTELDASRALIAAQSAGKQPIQPNIWRSYSAGKVVLGL